MLRPAGNKLPACSAESSLWDSMIGMHGLCKAILFKITDVLSQLCILIEIDAAAQYASHDHTPNRRHTHQPTGGRLGMTICTSMLQQSRLHGAQYAQSACHFSDTKSRNSALGMHSFNFSYHRRICSAPIRLVLPSSMTTKQPPPVCSTGQQG